MPETISPAPRIALVTGGARRIGRAIALALAGRGWDIAVHYGTSGDDAEETAAAIRALGRRAVTLRADLSDERATLDLFERCCAELGTPRCVVNNASRFDHDSIADVSQATLDVHMHTNLVAPLLLARALHAATPADARGHEAAVVINLLDQKLFNPNPDFLSYTLSKAALHSATTLLAQALAPQVRVVGVAPGLTMISYLQTPEAFAATHALSPLGRSSEPEDVVASVLFAVENRALTGTTILVDGGQHLQPAARDFSLMKVS